MPTQSFFGRYSKMIHLHIAAIYCPSFCAHSAQAAEAVTLSARRQWQQRGRREHHKRIDAHLQTHAECKSHVKPPVSGCLYFVLLHGNSMACIPRILQPVAHCFVPSRINAVALLKIYGFVRILYAVCFSHYIVCFAGRGTTSQSFAQEQQHWFR